MLDEMDIHGAKTALKLSNLSQVEKEFVALNSKHGDELFDFAKGLSATSDISSSLSKNIDKLKSGFKGTWNVIKSFVSAHKVGVGIGAAVALGTAVYTGYKMYKEHLVDTANAATEAWDNSLSDIQSKIQQYQELKTKLDSGDLSQSETIEVKQQILDLQNQIVASYGDQAQGIDLVNGRLDEELQKLQNISQQELTNRANESLNKNGSAYKDAQKEMEKDRSYTLGSSIGNEIKGNDEFNNARKEILKIADDFKEQGIKQVKDPLTGMINIVFDGDASQADKVINNFETKVRDLQNTYGKDNTLINSVIKTSSKAVSKNSEVLDKYQDNYKSFLEQSLYAQNNGGDAHILNDYADAVSNLNDALSSQDADKIHSAEAAYNDAKKAKDDFLSTDGNEQFSTLFDDIEDQLNSATQKAYDFKEAIEGKASDSNQFKKQTKDIQKYSEGLKKAKLDTVDVQKALEEDGFQKGEYYIQKLAKAFGLTSENMDTESIQAFANVLADIGLVAGETGSNISSLSNQIEELLNRTSLLAKVSDIDSNPIFDSIAKADESKNAGDDYVKGYQYLKEAKKMYDKGLIGTDDFKTRAAYFSPTESNDPANFIENYKKAKRYFTEGSTGVENFLTDLEKKGYAASKTLSDGTKKWTFNIKDLQDAAQHMGVGFEAFMDMFGRLEDYGAHNNFVSSVEDGADRITDLSTQLAKEQAKLAEMETTGQYTTTDSDGKKHKTMANQTALDAQREKVNALKNDIKETQQAMDELTRKDADDYNQQVSSAKQAINTLKEERDKIKSENAYGDNTDSIVELMDAQIKRWAEDNKITLDADLNIVDDPSKLEDEVEPLKIDVDYSDLSGLREQAENSLSTVQSIIDKATTSKISLDLDNGNLRNIDTQIETVKNALSSLQNENGEIDISTPGAQEAISVLNALYAQRQNLTGEVIMSIDTSKLDGDVQTVISKLQEFHQAYTELQNLNTLNQAGVEVNTTDAENKLSSLTNQLQNLDGDQAEIFAKIVPDPSSTQSIESSIGQVTVDALVNDVKMPESAIKTNATVDYTLGEQDDPKNKSAKVNYALGSQAKPKNMSAKVNYTADLTGLPPTLPPITRYVNYRTNDSLLGGAPKASGSFAVAYSSGTAYNVQNYKRLTPAHAAGDVALKQDERALVNEEYLNGHSESIVRDGVWSLIPGGAHVENLKRGDIIFSAKQTDDLLRTGATPGHARAYASGTLSMSAYANGSPGGLGGVTFGVGGSGSKRKSTSSTKKSTKSKSKSSDKSTNANTKATDKNTTATNKNTEATENLQDWIEYSTNLQSKENDRLYNAIESFEMHANQNKAIDAYITDSQAYMNTLRNAQNAYMSKANSLGLDAGYIHKIWAGDDISFEDIQDENLRDKISKYQDYYEKAKELGDQMTELNQKIRETKISKLDNIQDDFDNLVSYAEGIIDYNEAVNDLFESRNLVGNQDALMNNINQQMAIRQALVNEEKELTDQLNALVASGDIAEYTDTWLKWKTEINGVTSAIVKADSALEELKQSIMEIRYKSFEDSLNNLDFNSEMFSSIRDLMSQEGIYDDNIKLTDSGKTQLALMEQELISAKQKVANYNTAIEALAKDLAYGNISQAQFNEKLQEYQKDQMSAVKATKDARDAILDLVKDGITKESEAVQELIQKRKDDLSLQKEYYDFQKKMNDKSKEMNKIRSQIAAMEGDNSLETVAKRKKLMSQLQGLEEEYNEELNDRKYDIVQDAYDKTNELTKENEEKALKELETNLNVQNEAIANALEVTKVTYQTVYDQLNMLAQQYNFTLTDSLTSPWLNAQSAIDSYQQAIGKVQSNVSIDTSQIQGTTPSQNQTVPTKNEASTQNLDKSANGTWLKQGEQWWYQHAGGDWTNNGWEQIDGKWYKFDQNGWMQSGWQPWGTDSTGQTAWYYMGDPNDGSMKTSTWVQGKDGKQYFVDHSGVMARNGYVKSVNSGMYYWVNGDGVWEPQWNTYNPNLNKYKLYYNSGKKRVPYDTMAYTDDTSQHKLDLGSEVIITNKGVLREMNAGDMVFSKEQKEALWNLSNGQIPSGARLNLPTVNTNFASMKPVNKGDININYGSLLTVNGDIDKEVFPGMQKTCELTFDYFVKNMRKYKNRLN